MKLITLLVSCLFVSGCAYYMTPRPPIMERKMGAPFSESTGILATAADYRVVYVQIKPGSPICPEPSPDVAGQFASSLAAALKADPIQTPMSAQLQSQMAVSMKQLFRRTQGVQFLRDGLSDLCIDRFNGFISPQEYAQQKRELREKAYELIKAELPFLNNTTYDSVPSPTVPTSVIQSDSAVEP